MNPRQARRAKRKGQRVARFGSGPLPLAPGSLPPSPSRRRLLLFLGVRLVVLLVIRLLLIIIVVLRARIDIIQHDAEDFCADAVLRHKRLRAGRQGLGFLGELRRFGPPQRGLPTPDTPSPLPRR